MSGYRTLSGPTYTKPAGLLRAAYRVLGPSHPAPRGASVIYSALLSSAVRWTSARSLPAFHLRVDQKSLSVPAHVINEQVKNWDWLPGSSLEKCCGRTSFEIGPGRHGNGHHLTIRRKIEEFSSVSPPTRLFASSNRDLPLAPWFRKGGHVNFSFPGFVGGVCHPFAVRRELSIP